MRMATSRAASATVSSMDQTGHVGSAWASSAMRPSKRCGIGAVVSLVLLALAGFESAAAAPQQACNARLTVELTPDVPDATDVGFLSSLLNDNPAYRLDLLRQVDPALIEVELAGPGPEYLCQNVIESMRKDARVLSIRVDSSETQAIRAVTAPPAASELWGVQVSGGGMGSLYWAARHPSRAWRVLLPVRSTDRPAARAAN